LSYLFSSETTIPSASKRMNQVVSMIRTYMRDLPELNRLIAGEETNDRMIAWAVVDSIEDWNTTPPFIGAVGLTNFPSISWLRQAAVMRVLESVGLLQTRNQLTYSDGGTTVNRSDKAPLLLQWISLFERRLERDKGRIKSSMNIELAMDGTGLLSEYWLVNSSYISW
jgi:hypothetical protein